MTVWCGGNWNGEDLPPEAMDALRAGVPGELIFGGDPRGEVLFGQPDPEKALTNPDLKWIHLTSAGYTRYDTPSFRERLAAKGAALTNSSSVYDEPCAQHLLAMMLAFARQLPQAVERTAGVAFFETPCGLATAGGREAPDRGLRGDREASCRTAPPLRNGDRGGAEDAARR